MSGGVLQTTLITAVAAGIPLLYAALGELLVERVGLFNVGLEGVMLIGAVVGFMAAADGRPVAVALLFGALAAGVFSAVVFGLPVLWLRAPEILAGFATWFIGMGLSAQLGVSYAQKSIDTRPRDLGIPGLADLPFFGPIFFDQPLVVYLGVAATCLVAFILQRTRHGLSVRAVGGDPEAAVATGVPVFKIRLFYVWLGGMLTGLGGAILSVLIVHGWRENMTAGRGFVALALVLFVARRPLGLLWASYLFGILLILGSVGQAHGWGVPSEFLDMAPYVVTIVILVARSQVRRIAWPSLLPSRDGSPSPS